MEKGLITSPTGVHSQSLCNDIALMYSCLALSLLEIPQRIAGMWLISLLLRNLLATVVTSSCLRCYEKIMQTVGLLTVETTQCSLFVYVLRLRFYDIPVYQDLVKRQLL